MTYALIVPQELLAELVAIRTATGMSIRRQILNAAWVWVQECKEAGTATHDEKDNKEVR